MKGVNDNKIADLADLTYFAWAVRLALPCKNYNITWTLYKGFK